MAQTTALGELIHDQIRRGVSLMIRRATRAAAARVYWMNRARVYKKAGALDMVTLTVRFARDNNRIIREVKREVKDIPLP
jgi:hypothetical protein